MKAYNPYFRDGGSPNGLGAPMPATPADVVRRDLPYYDATVREGFVLGMNEFMAGLGWLKGPVPYEQVVAVEFNDLWA